jgi:poly-gamma-glutamate capsule biosynthesis protein CapA/YwtB (metallophosphatase superfamily)
VKLALAGDTMLGRLVGERLRTTPAEDFVSSDVLDAAREADLFILNLECSISARGEPWVRPGKPFYFRAPTEAIDLLLLLGVDCVTLANNHALDYGAEALSETFRHLETAGIAWVGAGRNASEARCPRVLQGGGTRVGVVGVTDHPREYAATTDDPGVAYADLRHESPRWLLDAIRDVEADVVVVTPHWGPNMACEPVPHVRRAASDFRSAGATLVAGHSAHVFQGVSDSVIFDLGDFLDDYATDEWLRNDLGLLFLITFESDVATRLEAVPLKLDFCRTRLADSAERAWIGRRFQELCAAFGSKVLERSGRLLVDLG